MTEYEPFCSLSQPFSVSVQCSAEPSNVYTTAEYEKKEGLTSPSLCFSRIGSLKRVFNQSATNSLSSRLGKKSSAKNVSSQYRIATNVLTRTIRRTISSCGDNCWASAQWNRHISRWHRSTAVMYVRYVRKKLRSSS